MTTIPQPAAAPTRPLDFDQVASLRADYDAAFARLREEFLSGTTPVTEIVFGRAALVDTLLQALWKASGLDSTSLCLVAVGGYGRGELHPYSDVDIALLLPEDGLENGTQGRVESFVSALWDVGLEIGHSVRTIEQCRAEAGADLTVVTTLMESRLLCGSHDLYRALCVAIDPDAMWSSPEFFRAKLDEQQRRHAKSDDAFQQLEPNIKESPGGLRDIQTLTWVAKRHFGIDGLLELKARRFLNEEEYESLTSGQAFLWQVRTALHFLSGRRQDRLLFDLQTSIAELFGYTDGQANRAVEQFMRRYYRTVRDLANLNEILLSEYDESILRRDRISRTSPLNRRFQVRDNEIEVQHPKVFERTPPALLELFLLMQQHPHIRGVRASTIRAIRANLHRIDDSFRADVRCRSLFMEIVRQPRRIGHELHRMHRYGVLGAYLPLFAQVEGLMQFDLFHVYTVDEHTLFVVRNLRRFSFPDSPEDRPALVAEALSQIPKLELLYLGGLFHDIAKGRSGNHSEVGADEAAAFCKSHGLSNYDTHMVAWLVRNHLLMSSTAQRKDIYDPAVIAEFARVVCDITHLNYLYLLTVADIRATNPELWTSWKASLLSELYRASYRHLRRGGDSSVDDQELVAQTRSDTEKLLASARLENGAVRMFWDTLGDGYFLRHRPEEIAWHTRAVMEVDADDLPLIATRTDTERGGTLVFVYARDTDGIFATSTGALDRLRLDVHEARIITSQAGFTLDTYMVTDAESGQPVTDPERLQDIRSRLRSALLGVAPPAEGNGYLSNRRLEAFSFPPEIEFNRDWERGLTVIGVVARDRPGLLSRLGRALASGDVRIHDARIATFGERAEDFFYVTDSADNPLDEAGQEALHSAILAVLDD